MQTPAPNGPSAHLRLTRSGIWGYLAFALLAGCFEDHSALGEIGVFTHADARAADGDAGAPSDPPTPGGPGGDGRADDTLGVDVKNIAGLTIEVVTLGCAGECADIEAVAHGGHPPYAFQWEDGSTSATRRVCLLASGQLEISVTDTAIEASEFGYAAQTKAASVRADVLSCPGGDAGGPAADAGDDASADAPDAGPPDTAHCRPLVPKPCGESGTVSFTLPFTPVVKAVYCLHVIENQASRRAWSFTIWSARNECAKDRDLTTTVGGGGDNPSLFAPPGAVIALQQISPVTSTLTLQLTGRPSEDLAVFGFAVCERCPNPPE